MGRWPHCPAFCLYLKKSIMILTFLRNLSIIMAVEEIKMDISKAICHECGKRMAITRVHCEACDLSLEGEFEIGHHFSQRCPSQRLIQIHDLF